MLMITAFILNMCSSDDDWDIKLCSCPSTAPWSVESLDLGLPCFKTKEECEEWAKKSGYGDEPCIKCD